jgi:DDE superfamily endonuclease
MVKIFSSQPFYTNHVCQPTSYDASTHPLRHNPKLYPFFHHALGTIDGSHIHFAPPAYLQTAYRSRKGFLSQNCLFGCSFDLFFTYALTGWEGSAADARIYEDAITSDLAIPDGHYYLADAGFPHCDQLLVPYRGVRYHLAEWGRVKIR